MRVLADSVDFQETYAPTTNNLIISKVVCQISTTNDWFMTTMDVTAAFILGAAVCRMFACLSKSIDP